METKLLSKKAIFLGIFLLLLGGAFYTANVNRLFIVTQLGLWSLVPEPEHLTELYLNDYDSLPTSITSSQNVPISFSIHNLEGATSTYSYTMYTASSSPKKINVTGSIVLSPDEVGVVKQSIKLSATAVPIEIFVSLPNQGLLLHFILPKVSS